MHLDLQTRRLRLRSLDASYAEAVAGFLADNAPHLEPWEPARSPSYYTVSYQRELLLEDADLMKLGQLCKAWIFLDDRLIGSVAFNNIIRGAFLSCHLGYRLDRREWNKGYMTESVRAMIAFAFERLGLHRIEANVMPRNGASLRVLRKLGFYEEGLAYKYLKINGVWEDHLHMVLRNEKLEASEAKPSDGPVPRTG